MSDSIINLFSSVFSLSRKWIIYDCFIPSLFTGIYVTYPILLSSLILRACVLWIPLHRILLDTLATFLGLAVLWWFYETSTVYFLILAVLIYLMLMVVPSGKRGVSVGGVCVLFIVLCELVILPPVELHKIRGSLLVVVMKLISLAFDSDSSSYSDKKDHTSVPLSVPDFMGYLSYSLFPSSTVFGPYMTYSEHLKYTRGVPLSINWIVSVGRSLALSCICLSVSMCLMPFMFEQPLWNKWLSAYAAAGSFRYSHYFVTLLSECSVILVGAGFVIGPSGDIDWSGYRTVHLFNIELPRSLSLVVTGWNIPMHHFLKNYVFKPYRAQIGRLGAILITYIASAMLHGLNFQLAAVLLSTGLYAYIESVFRYKLSKHLNACIQDRPCTSNCSHKYKESTFVVICLNLFFTFLAMFHLAYLGLMFGGSEDDGKMDEGYSMMHTLKKWRDLDFLSHWIALGMWALSCFI